MSRRVLAPALAALALSLSMASASTQQLGSAADAKAMLERAVAALKSNETAALREFNDPNDKQFRDRDLYVFCFDMSDGKVTAYTSPALIGIDVRSFKLKDDPIGQRAYDALRDAPDGGIATIGYNFPKHGTTVPVPKQSLEARVGNQGCAVAYYK
jgi:cytochrome c